MNSFMFGCLVGVFGEMIQMTFQSVCYWFIISVSVCLSTERSAFHLKYECKWINLIYFIIHTSIYTYSEHICKITDFFQFIDYYRSDTSTSTFTLFHTLILLISKINIDLWFSMNLLSMTCFLCIDLFLFMYSHGSSSMHRVPQKQIWIR